MSLKKIIFLFVFAMACLNIQAQAERHEHHHSADTVRERGEHNVGWIRSHIMDNWALGIQGGGQLYCGYEDFKGPLGSHLAGNVEGFVGRWLFPMMGLRAVAGYGTSHGFITLDSYLQNRDAIRSIGGYGTSYGVNNVPTTIGNTTLTDGALGGYYFPLDGHDDLLIQKWNYIYAGLDFMVNFSYLKRYDHVKLNRRWEHMGYIGFNIRMGLCEKHPQITAVNTNFAAEGHLGYIMSYNLSNHWSLNLDARLSLLEGLFDREKIPGVEKMMPDMNINIMGGITYNFNLRSKVNRMKYYVERNILPYTMDPDSLSRFINYVQIEDIDVIEIIDTLVYVYTDTVDDEKTIERKKMLEDKRKQLIDQFKNLPADVKLSNILKNRLLPYEMVFFERDKWDIRPQEEMKIAKMARVMKAFPEFTFILYGSADSRTGTIKRNWFLSENRADVVYNKLVYEYDIPEKQLKREWLGGILDYDPYILNRTTVIIMDHPAVRLAFEAMKADRKAGGGVTSY